MADELVQEVMTRVWLKAEKYNASLSNLNTWIFTLARNCRIDYLRRNSRYVSEIDPTDIYGTQVLLTILAGEIVYDRGAQGASDIDPTSMTDRLRP